ncbi:MAG: trypsin-like peptidase domain-containing protein [Nevskiales bacterium]
MSPLKVWFLRIFLAGCVVWQGAASAEVDSNQIAMNLVYQRSLPSIVSITVRDHNGVLRRGSGFFVKNNGLFITTFGVVENAHRITIRTEDGWLHSVDEVIALDKASNLALLRAPITKTRSLEVVPADKQIPTGETAIAVAGTQGLQWHISHGQTVEAPEDKPGFLHFNTPLLPGNEGGPLLNSYGRVIGVLLPPPAAAADETAARPTAITAADIHTLLDKINVLPLTATWTAKPPPPKPKLKPLPSADEEAEGEQSEAAESSLEAELKKELAKEELATALEAEEVARKNKPEPATKLTAKPAKASRDAAQYLGQVKTVAWATVPTQPAPAEICPPMISQHLDGEFRIRTIGNRGRADGLLSLGGRLDTGKECNMWGCFDGYRLYMHFVISNQNGKTLYRDYFEVDEDDVNEACEELAEDIVDELEDILD